MKIFFFGNVRDYTDNAESFETGADSVRALIDLLGEHFGAPFREFLLGDETCFFLVNGSAIMATGGLATPLRDDDTVEILPFVEGG